MKDTAEAMNAAGESRGAVNPQHETGDDVTN